MIVLFQILIFSGMPFWQYISHIFAEIATRLYCNKIKELQKFGEKKLLGLDHDEKDNMELKFIPSLKLQKYLAIQDILKNKEWKKAIHKAVEFSYTDLQFFKYANNFPNLNTILEVDINPKYKNYQINNFRYSSSKKFDITLFSGCIKDPDERLLNTDLIIALNMIEYLYPNILEALPYNIFEFSKPSIVILSTFNADLKYIFPSEVQFSSDKKLEWTRDQFMEWAYNITSRFPNYVVFFEGIGSLPMHPFVNLGAFTEVAMFYKLPRNEKSSNCIPKDLTSYGICTYMNYTDKHSKISDLKKNDPDTLSGYYYKYITASFILSNNETDYNFIVNCILHEIAYKLQIYGQHQGVYYNYNEKRLELPVTELYKSLRNLITMEELILLLKQYYVIENRLLDNTTIYLCVIWDLKNKPIDKLTAITKKGTTSDSEWETISIETVSQSRTSLPNSRLDIINSVTNPEVTDNSSNKSVFTPSGGSGDQLSPELGAENEMLKKIQFDLMSKKRTNCKYFEKYPSAELNKYYSARYNQLKNCSSCSNISNTAIQNGDFNSGTSIASQYRPFTPIIESYKSSSSSR